MYGRYTKDLGDYAKEEAKKLAKIERIRKKEDRYVCVFLSSDAESRNPRKGRDFSR